jgi:integrase
MDAKIDTVTARGKLKARRDPYWQRISRGLFVGFRKMTSDATGTWIVRYRADSGTQLRQTLGSLDQFPAFERFDRAADAAQKWLKHINLGGTTKSSTVMDACESYTKKIRELKGDKAADDLEARYRRWISEDPIHRIEMVKLTREHVTAFRQRLIAAPVKVGRTGNTRLRSKDTVNRDMAAVRAALNMAVEDGKTTSNLAWRKPLAAFKNVSKRRELYLDREQRMQLIHCAPPDLARFIRGLSMLPLRPGALAALTVADFDTRVGVLKIGEDKSGKDRRLKLPPAIEAFLKESAADRPLTAPLFAREDGLAWNKDSWKKPLKTASAAARLPAGTIAYALRHSAISDLVHGGLDLLTVAQISGTSVTMIERHYGHLRNDVAALALSKLVL